MRRLALTILATPGLIAAAWMGRLVVDFWRVGRRKTPA